MRYPLTVLLCLICLVFIISCDKENDQAPSYYSGKNYFPDKEGLERVYLVDSIAWDDFSISVDTFQYFMKEVIAGHYNDNAGRITQRIERYWYDSLQGNWIIWKVWAANLTATSAEVVEDNYRFQKLVFSPRLNLKWNGNVHNTLDPQEYKITSVHQPDSNPWLQFDSTLTVLQEDDFSAIYDRFAQEKYASGTGMYYRHQTNVETTPNGQIVSGFKYTARLFSVQVP